MISLAWISMSVACPWKLEETWWMRILAFGRAIRFSALQPARSRAPIHRFVQPGRASLAMGFRPLRGQSTVGCRLSAALAAGRPDLLGGLALLFLLRRPELVARLRLLDRDRLRVLDQQVDRLAHRDV